MAGSRGQMTWSPDAWPPSAASGSLVWLGFIQDVADRAVRRWRLWQWQPVSKPQDHLRLFAFVPRVADQPCVAGFQGLGERAGGNPAGGGGEQDALECLPGAEPVCFGAGTHGQHGQLRGGLE